MCSFLDAHCKNLLNFTSTTKTFHNCHHTNVSVSLRCMFNSFIGFIILITRKYPLRGYILGVLTHTTALDRLWGGDETLTMWF